jgi:glucose-1-phosphate adenylyltransferase
MNDTMGIILTDGSRPGLKELAAIRSGSALPVGGKYRAIDFVLSNMVNSGIKNVGVLTQYSYRSLVDHLGSGKEWDLDRRYDGLFIFPPYLSEDDTGWYRGTSDAMYKNLTFLRRSNEEYVIIAQGNCIYKMLFDRMMEFHRNKNADITISYREMDDYLPEDLSQLGIMVLDDDERVIDMQEKSLHPVTRNGSMGIYLLKRQLLIDLLEECVAHGNYDFVKDILVKKLETLRIYGFHFDGYWRNLSTVRMYYRCNMEMLDPDIRYRLFMENGKIYTKVKDETPAKYNDEAEVTNSVVADGCIIEGAVENSVLFRGVKVGKGALVRDSIIMQGSVVEENASLQHVILDKNVSVTGGRTLKGERNWPVVVSKDVVV